MRGSAQLFTLSAVFALLCACESSAPGADPTPVANAPIKVGILHSLSGTMAISEKPVVDATLLAIEEVNEKGGVNGRKLEAVIADGKSDWPTFAKEAQRLISEENVSVIFGCWTSASRKTVKPVFERLDHLLFYPVQYEGLEQSPNIVYTGAAPNQQIIPAVKWSFDNLGKKFFLVGSDYVFPRTANAIIRDQLAALGGEIVGEEYLLLGSKDVQSVVDAVVAAKPDVILNTINGDSNVAFYKALRKAGVSPKDVPSMSFSIAEPELQSMNVSSMIGEYTAWNYFQSAKGDANASFVRKFKEKYGADRVTSDPLEAAYFGVHLWAQAAGAAKSPAPADVRRAITKQSFPAPEGTVSIDSDTNHTWKTVRIGKVQADGQFEVVWNSGQPVRPVPYPVYRPRAEWESFLKELYTGWGDSWANPGK